MLLNFNNAEFIACTFIFEWLLLVCNKYRQFFNFSTFSDIVGSVAKTIYLIRHKKEKNNLYGKRKPSTTPRSLKLRYQWQNFVQHGTKRNINGPKDHQMFWYAFRLTIFLWNDSTKQKHNTRKSKLSTFSLF